MRTGGTKDRLGVVRVSQGEMGPRLPLLAVGVDEILAVNLHRRRAWSGGVRVAAMRRIDRRALQATRAFAAATKEYSMLIAMKSQRL